MTRFRFLEIFSILHVQCGKYLSGWILCAEAYAAQTKGSPPTAGAKPFRKTGSGA